jgi:hypothetical protein
MVLTFGVLLSNFSEIPDKTSEACDITDSWCCFWINCKKSSRHFFLFNRIAVFD